jgi:hypothetical protein
MRKSKNDSPEERKSPRTVDHRSFLKNAVADIYAFLKSLPPPPQAKDIPLLNQ